MIDTMRDDDDEQIEEYRSDTTTLETLIIQAVLNQTTNIVAAQNRGKRQTQESALKSAEVLETLARTAIILGDAQWIHITPGKVQGLVNRAILEDTLHHRSIKRDDRPQHDPAG